MANDPLERISFLEGSASEQLSGMVYRFAYWFNQLDAAEQQAITPSLEECTEDGLIRYLPDGDGPSYFRPEVVIFTGGQLHLVAWMASETPLQQNLSVGEAYVYLMICATCHDVPHAAQIARRTVPPERVFLNGERNTSPGQNASVDVPFAGCQRGLSSHKTRLRCQL